MASVYSTPFLSIFQDATTEGTYFYDVPEGLVAVVRTVDFFIGSTAEGTTAEFRGSSNQGITGQQWLPLSSFDAWHWEGRHVFAPGTQFSVVLGPGVHATVSGYLLKLP